MPHHHDSYGNPEHLSDYLEKLESPDRRAWQKPDEVMAALRIPKGATACEVGGGTGYFSLRLARAVGGQGHVFAVDASPPLLSELRDRIAREGIRNVTPVLSLPGDPLLPPTSCDLALMVNTFHHFPDKTDYLRRLANALRPGGRVALIDFHEHELPVGPPPEQKVSRTAALEHGRAAGFALEREEAFLPYQYFLVWQRPG